jgi:hypothetical protein
MEIPPGEIIDRITILQIKMEQITDEQKLGHVYADLLQSLGVLDCLRCQVTELKWDQLSPLMNELRGLNQQIWDIENNIRRLEKIQDFGEEFIQTARSVYFTNDKRANIKKQINKLFDSDIQEEKSYEEYMNESQNNG